MQLHFEIFVVVIVRESHRDAHQSGCQDNMGEAITATHRMEQKRHSTKCLLISFSKEEKVEAHKATNIHFK